MTERERNGHRAPRARGAARTLGTAAVLSAVVIVAGCGGRAADQADGRSEGERAQGRATTSGVPIVEPPPGSGSDGLANLPVAASNSSLLVPGYRYDSDEDTDPDRSLLLLDLADEVVVDIPNHAEFGAVGFTTDGDAVWVAGDRSLGVRDASSGETSTIQIPDDIAGTLDGDGGFTDVLEAAGEFISVTVDAADPSKSQTLLFTADGSLHCAGPNGTALAVHGGFLWSDDARTRLEPTSCTLGAGLDVPLDRNVAAFHVDGASAYVILSEPDSSGSPTHEVPVGTVHRFDVVRGRQTAVSPSIPAEVPEMTVQGDEVWILTDHEVRRLDSTTLEIVDVTPLPGEVVECDGWPRLVTQADRVFLLDDCTAVLYLLDPATGAARSGWRLPSPGESDFEITEIPTEEGIWMVDFDQSQLPFLFDVDEQRFERPPVSPPPTTSILASDFAVHWAPPIERRPAPSPTAPGTTSRATGPISAGVARPE